MMRFLPFFVICLYRKGTKHSYPFATTNALALIIRPYETLRTNHCLFSEGTFPTDTPFLVF